MDCRTIDHGTVEAIVTSSEVADLSYRREEALPLSTAVGVIITSGSRNTAPHASAFGLRIHTM